MIDIPFAPPLVLHSETVRPDWIDYNGHMNVAFYVMAFDHGTDALFEVLGIGAEYCRIAGCSMFAVDQRISYRRELTEGERLVVSSQVLGFDDKRLHFFQRMAPEGSGHLAATMESMGLHVDMVARRAAPFPAAARASLAKLAATHADLPWPANAGRAIPKLASASE